LFFTTPTDVPLTWVLEDWEDWQGKIGFTFSEVESRFCKFRK